MRNVIDDLPGTFELRPGEADDQPTPAEVDFAINEYKWIALMILFVIVLLCFGLRNTASGGAADVVCLWITREAVPYMFPKDGVH